jgi:hypothetical protein
LEKHKAIHHIQGHVEKGAIGFGDVVLAMILSKCEAADRSQQEEWGNRGQYRMQALERESGMIAAA